MVYVLESGWAARCPHEWVRRTLEEHGWYLVWPVIPWRHPAGLPANTQASLSRVCVCARALMYRFCVLMCLRVCVCNYNVSVSVCLFICVNNPSLLSRIDWHQHQQDLQGLPCTVMHSVYGMTPIFTQVKTWSSEHQAFLHRADTVTWTSPEQTWSLNVSRADVITWTSLKQTWSSKPVKTVQLLQSFDSIGSFLTTGWSPCRRGLAGSADIVINKWLNSCRRRQRRWLFTDSAKSWCLASCCCPPS